MSDSTKRTLNFSVCGEFITDAAREKLKYEHDLISAIHILMGATVTDQLTEEEHTALCLEILSGTKSIVGTYPGNDYGVENTQDIGNKNPLMPFLEIMQEYLNNIKDMKSELNDLYRKYSFVLSNITDYKLEKIATDYELEYGEKLFKDQDSPKGVTISRKLAELEERTSNMAAAAGITLTSLDKMLEETIQANSYSEELQKEDYGWLEPNGTYHPVTWGDHQQWAYDWLKTNRPIEKYPELYGNDAKKRFHNASSKSGDIMVDKLHWILLHSPHNGVAHYIVSDEANMTKAQREFLYDYYTKRNLTEQANNLYKNIE